jgi:hypothetical protein
MPMMLRDFVHRRTVSFGLLMVTTACSSGDGGNGRGFRGGQSGLLAECSTPSYICPDSGAPSYENDVVPILNARCNGCHGNGGQEAVDRNLTTLLKVQKLGPTVASLISSCQMPPPPLAPLTPKEQATVLEWFACGCPNNASNEPPSCAVK